MKCVLCPHKGVEINVSGNPGHGSRFIEDTAVEKLVCNVCVSRKVFYGNSLSFSTK